MIKNFSDHMANERTFLAWVRTSIAVIAFGFLVERFDLFLSYLGFEARDKNMVLPRSGFGHVAGLVLIILGIVMVGIAAFRFARNARQIDEQAVYPGTGSRLDLALAALIIILSAALLFYLGHAISAKA